MKSIDFDKMQKDVIVTFSKVRKSDGTVRKWALFKSYFDTIEVNVNVSRDKLIRYYEFLRDTLEKRNIIPDEDQLRGFLWKFACNKGKTDVTELENLETMEEPLNMVWQFQVEIGRKQETKILNLAWIVKMSQDLCVSFDDVDQVMFDVIEKIENKHYDDEIQFRDRLINTLRKKLDIYEENYIALQ